MRVLSERIERFASTPAWSFGLVPAVLLPLPWMTGVAGPEYLVSAALVAAVGAGLALLAPRESRRAFLGLFAIAWTVRLIAHPLLYAWAAASGGPFLGPDSTTYFDRAVTLTANGFETVGHPALALGSYDCAPYYVFAALVRVVGPDLYALQTLNAALLALAAPLIYGAGRRVVPDAAGVIGLAIAVYPSLVALGINDLLKDPSVIAATLVVVWASLELAGGRRVWPSIALVLLASVALGYLRMARVYVPAFLEFGLAVALVVEVVRTRRAPNGSVLWLTLVIALAEVVPWTLGWPLSPFMLSAQARFAMTSPELLHYAEGFANHPLLALLFNPVRRLFGPFPWIAPPALDARIITRGDYLLMPGVVAWYAVMPVAFAGLLSVSDRLRRGVRVAPALVALLGFTLPMLALYLTLNLSYRQREFMFPFLLVFAALGLEALRHVAWWPRAYAGYWALIGVGATGHLVARAWLT